MPGQFASDVQTVPGAFRQRRDGTAKVQLQVCAGLTTVGEPVGVIAMKPISFSVPPEKTGPAAAVR
jgi:hypothetical protein